MCQFFCQNLLFIAQALENETILGGHRAPFFRKWVQTLLYSTFLRGSSDENEFHICVRVCGVEGRGKSLSSQFFFVNVCEKDDREESSTKSLGGMTRP